MSVNDDDISNHNIYINVNINIVIADSSRLEILDLLSCGELCACDLLEHFS
ncbi:ArsR family transcriptional regulator, partial [Staphylococcus capitis]|uniref:ArsR family transcriptional regulator n=1 Tax=Staphylococcus capitis TaxID=29388 RepID=UPI00382D60DD